MSKIISRILDNIKSVPKKISSKLSEFFKNLLEALGIGIEVIGGIALILGGLFLSFQIVIKPFPAASNLVAWAGACLGTVILMNAVGKRDIKKTIAAEKKFWENEREREDLKKRDSEKEQVIKEIKEKYNSLEKEYVTYKENQKSIQSVEGIRTNFQIGLLEVNKIMSTAHEPRVIHKYSEQEGKKPLQIFGKTIGKKQTMVEHEEVYEGKVTAKYKEKMGIDLRSVKVARTDKEVIVTGLKGIRIGIENLDIKHDFAQIKDKKEGDSKSTVDANHPKLAEEKQKDIDILIEAINKNNLETDSSRFLENAGEFYLRVMLTYFAQGRKIVFKNNVEENSMPLLEFIGVSNRE